MRAWMSIIVSIFFLQAAQAADVLRGSSPYVPGTPTYFNWSGFYVGVQAGYGNANVNASESTRDLLAYMLRETTIEAEAHVSGWPSLRNMSKGGGVFGGFVGYNSQWGDVVLGLEANYTRGVFDVEGSDVIGRTFETADEYFYEILVGSKAKVKITDYATFRARAGYVMDYFMPYAFGGIAVGRADVYKSASVSLTATDVSDSDPKRPDLAYADSLTESRSGVFAYGVAAGLGIDVALTQNIFLRGEWEYVYFANFQGVSAQINSVRAGAGVKF
jgi:opacity protein-like surface antigen